MKEPNFQLRRIHQIEMTSHCNLRCHYCISPKLQRQKLHMDRQTFERALAMAKHLDERFPPSTARQNELNLAGIGESTIHPDFCDYVEVARKVMGEDTDLLLATNGLWASNEGAEKILKTLVEQRVRVWVSLHRPEKAKIACDMLAQENVLAGISVDPTIAAVDWAGQISNWRVTADPTPCPWVENGWGFVLADGRISACCFDGDGSGVFGRVEDRPQSLRTKPYKLCATCHQTQEFAAFPDYVQRPKLRVIS